MSSIRSSPKRSLESISLNTRTLKTSSKRYGDFLYVALLSQSVLYNLIINIMFIIPVFFSVILISPEKLYVLSKILQIKKNENTQKSLHFFNIYPKIYIKF